MIIDSSINISLGKSFLLTRHGRDIDKLTTKLNQPLSNLGKKEVIKFSKEIQILLLNNNLKATIISGPSLRTKETSKILFDSLSQKNLCVGMKETQAIREFFQGRFLVKNEYMKDGKYLPLELAWDVFIDQVSNKDDYAYNFGDCSVLSRGCPEYLLLKEIFLYYGENQYSFLDRIYYFLTKELYPLEKGVLKIVVTHQAIASRIQRIIQHSLLLESGVSAPPSFYEGNRVKIDYSSGVIVDLPKYKFFVETAYINKKYSLKK